MLKSIEHLHHYDNFYEYHDDFYEYYEDFHHQKFFFFVVCIYKMYLISGEGYTNAEVHFLRVQKTGEIWSSMKDVGCGMGVKNISDLVLKEI